MPFKRFGRLRRQQCALCTRRANSILALEPELARLSRSRTARILDGDSGLAGQDAENLSVRAA